MAVRLSSLPTIGLALLLLVAPAAAQAPDDPGPQGNPPDDPGQASEPPQTPPGQEDDGDAGPAADPEPASEPSEPEESGNQTTAPPGSSATVRGLSCRPLAMGVNPSKSPTSWFRADPDGCFYYTVKRLIERSGE